MRREQTETVRDISARRGPDAADVAPMRRLPKRAARTTKQMHERLLALRDRRIRLG